MRPIGRSAALAVVAAFSLSRAAPAQTRPPDACAVVTQSDVTAVLGTGYLKDPTSGKFDSGDHRSCLYQKGKGTTVAVTVMQAPDDDGKAAVTGRQELQKKGGREVTPLPDVCDAAFGIVISPTQSIVIAGLGKWQMDLQVMTGGKPDNVSAGKVAQSACRHGPKQ